MKRNSRNRYFLLCLLFLFVLACDISTNTSQDDQLIEKELELKITEVALQITQTAMAVPDSSEKEQPDSVPPDSEEDAKDASEDEIPCNSSRMVGETIADGTTFKAGETFTKSWTLKNVGDCDWTTDYRFVFEGGDQMNGQTSLNVPSVIEPGETVTFNINMTAPTTDGNYTGVWRLKSADGEKLGKYWVDITVGVNGGNAGDSQPSDTNKKSFSITHVNFTLEYDYGGFCPYLVEGWILIEASGAGDLYYTESSSAEGKFVAKGHLHFTKASIKYLPITLKITEGGDHWYQIHFEGDFDKTYYRRFHATCLF